MHGIGQRDDYMAYNYDGDGFPVLLAYFPSRRTSCVTCMHEGDIEHARSETFDEDVYADT